MVRFKDGRLAIPSKVKASPGLENSNQISVNKEKKCLTALPQH